MTEVEKLIEDTQSALAQVERERLLAVEAHRADLAVYAAETKRLNRSLRALRGDGRPKRTAAIQAGPKAIQMVRGHLMGGPLSQAALVNSTGLNAGTVSYALKALRESGEVENTGRMCEGSREVRLTRAAAAAAAA